MNILSGTGTSSGTMFNTISVLECLALENLYGRRSVGAWRYSWKECLSRIDRALDSVLSTALRPACQVNKACKYFFLFHQALHFFTYIIHFKIRALTQMNILFWDRYYFGHHVKKIFFREIKLIRVMGVGYWEQAPKPDFKQRKSTRPFFTSILCWGCVEAAVKTVRRNKTLWGGLWVSMVNGWAWSASEQARAWLHHFPKRLCTAAPPCCSRGL